jgi:AcrR family transcriptional regulator
VTGKPTPPDGRGERWAVHREERRAAILDAAIVVIEREPIGAEIHVRQIAEEAGLGRAVLYRHFTDRADLDRAVQNRILDTMMERLVPEFTLSGTIEDLIFRIVHAYVDWAAAHPALHRIGAMEAPDAESRSDLNRAAEQIGSGVSMLVTTGAALLSIELSDEDKSLLDPLVFGIVGQVFGSVRTWLARGDLTPAGEVLAGHLARSIWFQIDGLARDRGAAIDPAVSLDALIAAAVRTD